MLDTRYEIVVVFRCKIADNTVITSSLLPF